MRRLYITNITPHTLGLFSALVLIAAVTGCGGGGGGSGGSALVEGMELSSITFPKHTDLTGATATPPSSAPLSQQVVFTFTAKVPGNVSASGIRITTKPGFEYSGPLVVLDKAKNIIPARGSFEVMGNVVVFTPFIPTGELDLSLNAKPEKVPGLLPGFTYTIFVPVGTTGAIKNLMHLAAPVSHPVEFTTISPDLPSLFFGNHPAVPPEVVASDPTDGTTGFPVGTFSSTGLPPDRAIILRFDQPLDFSDDNMEGTDQNGSGVKDQNLFLEYTKPVLYTAVDQSPGRPGYIARLNVTTNEFELVGHTDAGTTNVGLRSVVILETHRMIGCDGNSLFDVGYEDAAGNPPVCPLTNERPLDDTMDVRALTFTRDGVLFAMDSISEALVRVDPSTGDLEVVGGLTPGLGPFLDMATGRDNKLYGLRVFNTGSPSAVCSIEQVDRNTGNTQPMVSNLQGDFSGIAFARDNRILLFESSLLKWVELDVLSGQVIASGDPITHPMLDPGSLLDFDLKRYELGVKSTILDNSYHGATVNIDPSGILPFGTWIDIMTRFSLANVSGGSLSKNLGLDPLGASSVARFETFDPGPSPVEDFFLEQFLDNDYEEPVHENAVSKALWNVQDKNQTPPDYQHLLAGLGWSGGGELGDFVPHPLVSPSVILDTNYQPLPLYDGSTPHVLEPTVVLNGEYHFHDIIIPEGVTLFGRGSKPLVLTATGRVEIGGTINISGENGEPVLNSDSAFVPTPSGPGGPGGGRGGVGQPAIPEKFQSLTELQSCPRGERGWGPGDLEQIGGQGGESGADGTDVSLGSTGQKEHRAAGGGGGSFLQIGYRGHPGKGKYGVDDDGDFYIRDTWDFWDGSYKFVDGWDPSQGPPPEDWKINQWFAKDDHRHPHPGQPGYPVFTDLLSNGKLNGSNDFFGENGELKTIQGGQGGGGGGSRLDSMNPSAKGQAAQQKPPLAASAFDGKGGGGGGGGACAIHSLGEIIIKESGRILATGGRGGGGEILGASILGGGAGGGSGGAILLNSASRIAIEYGDPESYGRLDVSCGWGADARLTVKTSYKVETEPCKLDKKTGLKKYAKYCSYSDADGGAGGYGLIQLMVPDPSDPSQLSYHDESIEAGIPVLETLPNFKKTNGETGFSYYQVDVVGSSAPFFGKFPTTTDCLAPPDKTTSTITPYSYAESRWIDFGQTIRRPSINGIPAPALTDFEGIINDGGWGVVNTQNGYVVNAHLEDFNDIEVDAPDLGLSDYIPESNEVAIQFQGTDALIPGSMVPNEDPAVMSEWTWDLASLSGKQFIRFRVKLNVAKDSVVTPSCLKPQANMVRLRVKY